MVERIGLAQEQIENELEKLRGLISELRPAALDELGLEASVRDLAERIAGGLRDRRGDAGRLHGRPRAPPLPARRPRWRRRPTGSCRSACPMPPGTAARRGRVRSSSRRERRRRSEVSVADDGDGFDRRRATLPGLRAARDARARGPDRPARWRSTSPRAAARGSPTVTAPAGLSRAAAPTPRRARARARSRQVGRGASGPACAGCARGGSRRCARGRNRRSAISRFVCPRAIRRSTSISRAVSSGRAILAAAASAARRAPSRGSR